MIKVEVSSDNYQWQGSFENDSEGLAFALSNSLWVEQLENSNEDVLAARFRFDGESIKPEYLVAQGKPGELYIVKVWGTIVRRGLVYPQLLMVICKVIEAVKSPVRKRSRRP